MVAQPDSNHINIYIITESFNIFIELICNITNTLANKKFIFKNKN